MKRASIWLFIALLTAAAPLFAQEVLQNIVDDGWQGAAGYRFSGRLTEVHPAPGTDSSRFSSFYLNTRMLLTSGEEGLVTWRVGSLSWTVRADDSGYWELIANQALPLAPGWHELESVPAASSPAGFLIVDPSNRTGIISDIDDTILVSGVLSTRTLLRNSLTVPPEKREAVPGMAALYARVLRDNPAPLLSPVFYVSSTPRQLTDNLRIFLKTNGFPRGVLQLKEVASGSGDSLGEHDAYKRRRIERILEGFPEVKFHLFGDDAERDPEIYFDIATRYPGSIAGVWIRRIHPDAKRVVYSGQQDVGEWLNSPFVPVRASDETRKGAPAVSPARPKAEAPALAR